MPTKPTRCAALSDAPRRLRTGRWTCSRSSATSYYFAPGADESHERRLGDLLAQQDDDAPTSSRPARSSTTAISTPASCTWPRAGSTRTRSGSRTGRTSSTAGTRASTAGVESLDDMGAKGYDDKSLKGQDVRDPQDLQRRQLHRRVPDTRVRRQAPRTRPASTRTGETKIVSRDFERVKQTLLYRLTNMGQPMMYVADANYLNRGGCFPANKWNGLEVDAARASPCSRTSARSGAPGAPDAAAGGDAAHHLHQRARPWVTEDGPITIRRSPTTRQSQHVVI